MSVRANATISTGATSSGAPRPDKATGGETRAPINCLLIEDSSFDRQRVRRIAEQTKLRLAFTEAASLDQAIEALKARLFDVILLDQTLPDGDGTVVAELMKRHLGKKTPPIIMVSGSQEVAMPARAFAAGCTDYISKDGLNIPGLEKAITTSIANSRAASPKASMTMAEHREALKSFADDTILELRIPLSRMLRLVARASDQHPVAAAELASLKVICREIWDYLDHLAELALQHRP